MTGLLSGELRRVLARRLVRVLALLALAGIAVAGVLVFLNTEKMDDAEVTAGRQTARARLEECLDNRSPTGSEAQRVPPDAREERCRFGTKGTQFNDKRFRLTGLKGILQGTTAPLVVVAWLIGASVIGADWQSRTMTTLLTWEPRRVRVLLAKAATCMLVAVLFAFAVDLVLAGALLPSALVHGTTTGTDGAWLRSLLGVVLRGGLLIAIATAAGFAMASIGRNTAAALGIGFAYFVVIENVVGSFLADFRRWLLLGNAIVLISGENGGGEVARRSVAGAGLFLTAVAVGLLTLATLAFVRRDVA